MTTGLKENIYLSDNKEGNSKVKSVPVSWLMEKGIPLEDGDGVVLVKHNTYTKEEGYVLGKQEYIKLAPNWVGENGLRTYKRYSFLFEGWEITSFSERKNGTSKQPDFDSLYKSYLEEWKDKHQEINKAANTVLSITETLEDKTKILQGDDRIAAWHSIYDYYLANQDSLGVYSKPTALGTIINCMENLVKLTKETPDVVQTPVKYTEEMYKQGIMPEKGILVWSHWAESYTTINEIYFHADSNYHTYKVLLNTPEGCIALRELKFPENEKDKELEEMLTLYKNTYSVDTTLEDTLKEVQQYFYDKYNLGDK